MSIIAKSDRTSAKRDLQWLRVVALGLTAFLFLAAAADRRNAIVDHTRAEPDHVGRAIPEPSNHDLLLREMLTHD